MNKQITFTFGIMVFNHENLVKECLESVKYQIRTYGIGWNFRLIITDDHSRDQSLAIIESWLKENHTLFCEVKVIANAENLGTVKNYQTILDEVSETDSFKVLAGDDVFSSANLFAQYNQLENHQIRSYTEVILKDGRVFYDKEYLARFYWKKYHKDNLVKRFRYGGYFHTPSTIFRKKLYNDSNCASFNSQFRLFEDDPTWYRMVQHVTPDDITFVDECIVLYRIHGKAVSNSKSFSAFDQELLKLNKLYQKEATGAERLYWLFRNKRLSGIWKYLDYSRWHTRGRGILLLCLLCRNPDFIKFVKFMDQRIQEEQKYYDSIIRTANC